MEGTYPLPEAQLDRFFCKLLVQFPNSAEIETILDRTTEVEKPIVQPVLAGERILEMSRLARQIPIADEVRRYGIAVVLATHPENAAAGSQAAKFVRFGASPRGAQSLILGAKIRAILDKRYHVSRDDLRAVAPQVLRHRLILNFEGQAEGIEADSVIEDILKTVTEPVLAA
jgi:MoxR-like ATPase